MSYPQYPYQLEYYTYRRVNHLGVPQYDDGWGNGVTAPGFTPYPGYYYPAPIAGPATVPRGRRPSTKPTLSSEERLHYLKAKLIKDGHNDRNRRAPLRPGQPVEEETPAAAAAAAAVEPPTPEVVPEVPPAAPPPPAATAILNWIEPLPAPLPQEETATEITPLKVLHYPAGLHCERVAKQQKWHDKDRHSPRTVFVLVHEVDGRNVDIQVASCLRDANAEVLRIMARYHPRTFKQTPLRRVISADAATATTTTAAAASSNAREEGGGIKEEGGEEEEQEDVLDDVNQETAKRERRYVYRGDWTFTHASTLRLEAKDGGRVVRVSCGLKNVRELRNSVRQKRKKEKRGGGGEMAPAATASGLTET